MLRTSGSESGTGNAEAGLRPGATERPPDPAANAPVLDSPPACAVLQADITAHRSRLPAFSVRWYSAAGSRGRMA